MESFFSKELSLFMFTLSCVCVYRCDTSGWQQEGHLHSAETAEGGRLLPQGEIHWHCGQNEQTTGEAEQ